MNYPNMVYKNGQRGEYRVCNNAREMVLAAHDDFWPIRHSKEWVLSNPAINTDLAAVKAQDEQKKKEDEIVDSLIKEPEEVISIEERYKNSTGRDAIQTQGRWTGKETKAFQAWKAMHKEN